MQESIFTKIVSGEIPCHKIYEDDHVFAFLDIEPRTEGHTLVIPKHDAAEFVWDLNDEMYNHVMTTCKILALHLREVTGKKYVHQAIVGTDVPYAHVHLVPFDNGEELHGRAESTPESLKSTAEKLRLV